MQGVNFGAAIRTGNVVSGFNPTANKQGLSEREMQIMREIQQKVGRQVKFNPGNTCEETGRTLAIWGFWGASANEDEPRPLLVSPHMLRDMAECESKFNEWMIKIGDSVQRQVEMENQFRANAVKEEEEDTERKAFRIKVNMMAVLDFWNDNREDASWTQPAQGQMLKNVAGQYASLLSGGGQ